ncbi:MAG: hypothetical protein ACK5V3_17295 [Bdellovibrionales bacterium]
MIKNLLITMLLIFSFETHAFNSSVTFSIDDMKKNETVIGASRGDKDQMLTIAARIFQLQLEAAKCEEVSVNQTSMIVTNSNKFSVSSKNCVIKNKKSENCDPGFQARNIPENPRTPDYGIIGGDIYKICLKNSGNGSVGTSSSSHPAHR